MKTSRFNTVPIIVQQLAEDVKSAYTPPNVKHNKVVVLEAIRDYCDIALRDFEKQEAKRAKVTIR